MDGMRQWNMMPINSINELKTLIRGRTTMEKRNIYSRTEGVYHIVTKLFSIKNIG